MYYESNRKINNNNNNNNNTIYIILYSKISTLDLISEYKLNKKEEFDIFT